MGTAREDMSPTVSSSKLHQKQASDILNRVEDIVKLEPNDGNCLLESDQERTPCINIIPKKEPDTLSQKQNPEGNQTLILSESSLTIKREPFDLHERQSSDAGHDVSESNEQERTYSCKSVNDSENPSADPGVPAQESNHNQVCRLTVLENILEKLQQMRNVENGGCGSKKLDQESIISNASEKSPIIPKNERDESVREGEKYTTLRKEVLLENQQHIPSLSVEVPISEFDLQKCKNKAEKLQPRRNPDPGVRSKLLEKGLLDDGYNWRKYGQKFIKKRNLLIRSYYKCTYPICEAKKQVEKLHDGYITDVYYFGEHRHPKAQESPKVASSFQARIREIPILTVSSADAELIIACADVHQHIGVNVVSQSNGDLTDKDDIPDSKRQKSETNVGDHNKANNDSRRVVETLSDVDVVNDGFRWRKYGQKFVKGSPNPRSYYRCSTNAGCRAKKHVERAANNPKVVITTYEGEHDHDVPPCTTNN